MLTIYKASAGSGKTYNLAYEYIKALITIKDKETGVYCLNHKKYIKPSPIRTFDHDTSGYEHNRHRAILAITFTNKATEEMKTRIIKELSALTMTEPKPDGTDQSPYAESLMSLTKCTRDELAQSAQSALTDLLYDYHFFNVSTIDSFFQNVLRTFARELDRPGDFELEIDDSYVIESGVDMMLDDFNFGIVGENSRIGEWIQTYMLDCVKEGKQFNLLNRKGNLHSELVNFAKELSKETFKENARDLREYFDRSDKEGLLPRYCKSLKNRHETILTPLKELAKNTLNTLASLGVTPDNINNTLRSRIEKNMLEEVVPSQKEFSGATINDAISDTVKKPSNYIKADVAKAHPEAIQPIKDLFITANKIYLEYWFLKELIACAHKMIMLGYVWNYIDRFRNENNIVLLSDTNDLLQRIIDRSETPFIYEKLGVELRHFLIDEFQDTSAMQWDNLKPLVATGLDEDNNSLIIGDEKQSIYRFRNSDSSLLHYKVAREDFPTRHTIRGSQLADNTNHRSSPTLVRFNNTLFSILSSTMEVDGYENIIQDIYEKNINLPGYIRFQAIDKEENPFDLTAKEIIRQHEEGKYRWRDIAILVNANKECNDVVSYLLKNHHEIPIASDESLLLNRSKSVNTVISMMKIIERMYQAEKPTVESKKKFPGKTDIEFMINRFDFYCSQDIEPDEALISALNPQKGYITDDDKEKSKSPIISSNIESILSHRPSTIVALAEVIIAETISPKDREKDMAYLVTLQDVIIDFNTHHSGDLRTFLRWWDINSDSLKVPSSPTQDAVRVMTIHKSKGLEFGCVILPFASWRIEHRKDEYIWVATPDLDNVDNYLKPPAMLIKTDDNTKTVAPSLSTTIDKNIRAQKNDNMNKTYVAYTRPIYELVAFYKPGKDIGSTLTSAFSQKAPKDNIGRPDLLIDLCDFFDPKTNNLTIGEPTINPKYKENKDNKDSTNSDTPKLEYNVVFRNDTREITAIESQTSNPENILARPLDASIKNDTDDIEDITPVYTSASNALSRKRDFEEEATRRGNILHDVLSHVKHRDDIPRAMKRTARRFRLDQQERDNMFEILNNAFKSNELKFKEIAYWFEDFAECRNEQPVYNPERDEIKRIDRIVTLPDGSVEIIDFKFTASDDHSDHRDQVAGYVNLLKNMGHTRVKGYLWYPLLESIIEVGQ